MWHTARRITVLVLWTVAVSAGAASAQSNAPAAPSTPEAPAAPAPATAAPSAAVTYPYALNVAFTSDNRLILTDAQGMTLYYLTNEIQAAPICTRTCATVWPPALAGAAGPAALAANPALSPMVVVTDANGTQLSYHGHLLYRYSKDTAPGQLNGDRVRDSWGTWAVATPDLPFWP
jgi:predicted lipoprotein with Yx(FWY)xxD motif